MKRLACLFAFCGLLFCRQPAFAGDTAFILVNHTGADIASLLASPSLADNWSGNLLGKTKIADGSETRISFAASNETGLWDFQTSNSKGEESEWPGVSLTEVKKVIFSFEDGEPVVTYE
jgi:hypothetical protein